MIPFAAIQSTIFIVLFLFNGARFIHAEPQQSNNTSALTEKIGIIDRVMKISALLVPPQSENNIKNSEDGEIVTYGNNPFYPECPSTCLNNWVGDGWCDTECAKESCGHDGGDCNGWCAPDCKPEWVGDGSCDVDCFRSECEYDKNDCAKNFTKIELQHPLPRHKSFDYSKCVPSICDHSLLHNGDCNAECNILPCNFDGGDCYHQCAPYCANVWLGDGDCDVACNVGQCGFDKGDCQICTPGCEPGMVANGICDTVCDVGDCESDAGDCYGVCWVAEKIDYLTEPFFYPHCRTEWRGDGYCDCFCMNEACDFDLGDCKGYDCSIEFALLKKLNERMNSTEYPFPNIASNISHLSTNEIVRKLSRKRRNIIIHNRNERPSIFT